MSWLEQFPYLENTWSISIKFSAEQPSTSPPTYTLTWNGSYHWHGDTCLLGKIWKGIGCPVCSSWQPGPRLSIPPTHTCILQEKSRWCPSGPKRRRPLPVASTLQLEAILVPGDVLDSSQSRLAPWLYGLMYLLRAYWRGHTDTSTWPDASRNTGLLLLQLPDLLLFLKDLCFLSYGICLF